MNEARKKVGFLFQESALYDSMTIEENVAFPLRRNTKLSDGECRDRAHQLLGSVGMDRDLDKMPADISGGMRKRVGLARALALEPTIVMFDEPTAGLDPITAAEIAKLIVELRDQRHITSIVVTHDLHTARTIADRLIVLDRGKTLFDGTFEGLNESKDPFIAQFVGDAANKRGKYVTKLSFRAVPVDHAGDSGSLRVSGRPPGVGVRIELSGPQRFR